MIALNELLDNLDLYKQKYAIKGLHVNLDSFVRLENERKIIQLKAEKMRALCNKLCSQVPTFQKNGKDTDELIKQITNLDEQIKVYNNTLKSYERRINSKLKKLHNLPECDNKMHEQIPIKQNPTNKSDLVKFINENYSVENYNKKILSLLKLNKNIVFDENQLPLVYNCKNGYVILGTSEQVVSIKKDLMKYFETNSFSLIKVSSKKMNKDNASSFFVHLSKRDSLYFETINEFYSREFKIKYHNKSVDMTKFVNQLNILFKW